MNFTEACNYMVRRLVEAAYSMADGTVRPAGQSYPTGVAEFATVKIIKGPIADFGSVVTENLDDPTTGSTKVVENLDNVYRFTASVQFFRHAAPVVDGVGLPTFGLGAVDKAGRLEVRLASTALMALMERCGLGLEGSGDPIDVGALVHDAYWEDRGSVTLDFTIVNREQFLVESIASVTATLKVSEPGAAQPLTETIEVTS